MSEERIQIHREELFSGEVDSALKQAQELRRRVLPTPQPISPVRKILLSSLFYLTLAGMLGALTTWLIIEPRVADSVIVGGQVKSIDTDPVGVLSGGLAITLGTKEAIVVPGLTALERGVDGQPALESVQSIAVNDYVEVSGALVHDRFFAAAVRPATAARVQRSGEQTEEIGHSIWGYLLFPLTAALVVLFLFIAEGLACRNWLRMVQRSFVGTSLTVLFSVLAFIPAGLAISLRDKLIPGDTSILAMPAWAFILCIVCRSIAWCAIGLALGCGMNLVRSTRLELRNSMLGGALGGAFGGLFFDPIDRFWHTQSLFYDAADSRLVGLLAVGLAVGFFVALSDRLAREAWVRIRSGPLTGKSFVLYRTPTIVGSSPRADIYLFKDADIDASHLAIHRVGNAYEVEDLSTRKGSVVGGQPLTRRRQLHSGDQIIVGNTVMEFEERARSRAPAVGSPAGPLSAAAALAAGIK